MFKIKKRTTNFVLIWVIYIYYYGIGRDEVAIYTNAARIMSHFYGIKSHLYWCTAHKSDRSLTYNACYKSKFIAKISSCMKNKERFDNEIDILGLSPLHFVLVLN